MNDLNWKFLIGLVLIIFGVGCQSAEPEFSRAQMLIDITDNVILPNHVTFVETTGALDTAVQNFSINPNETSLIAMQEAWVEANIGWMGVALFRFGDIESGLIHNRIDNRPPRIEFIDDTINSDETINLDFVQNIGSSSVGLGAIEYLIFDPEGGNRAVLNTYVATNGSQRMAYLTSISTYLNQQANLLNETWISYAEVFIASDSDGSDLQGALNLLANRMLEDSEHILSTRLGLPLGRRTFGEARPELAESIYANISLLRIEKGLITIHETFNGGDGVGLDDYLDYLDATYEGEPLSEAINGRFTIAITAIQSIDEPLTAAVINQPDVVDATYEDLRQYLILLKVDMPAQLGLTLTFSDNDGD